MIMEKSFQAQFLVPMAASLAFGLGLTTLLVLIQVPTLYLFYCIIMEFFGVDPNKALVQDEDGVLTTIDNDSRKPPILGPHGASV
jgi:hypothetical protein